MRNNYICHTSCLRNNVAYDHDFWYKKNQNFMAPFYGWGSTASRLQPLQGGSLLFATKFPEIPGTHDYYNDLHLELIKVDLYDT